MILMKLRTAARKLFRLWAHPTPEGLLPPEQMRKALARERARADRTGDRFAVVTFSLRGGPPDGRDRAGQTSGWPVLVKTLRARLRFTDEVGWLEEGQLCAVLGGTGAEGAAKVVHDINQMLAADFPTLSCTIYTYPSDGPAPERIVASGEAVGQVEAPRAGAIEPLFAQAMPVWKRAVDVVGASLGLLLLSPLFAVIALVTKLTSPGPVFFGQLRSGRGGKPFVIWKFRSMVVDAEARKAELMALNEQDGAAFKIRDDPRVTRWGRFLRKTSLDELPQLWNVLRGEMSLVGPRPLPCSEAENCTGWQRQRLDATPGLTCIWQVRGRSRVSFAAWVRMDVQYIRSRSPWHDLKLLLLTVPAVLLRRGAQ
jgi:lipopolysaccharide/colanic/teichoic acid biosynthesis glycosyltransferase